MTSLFVWLPFQARAENWDKYSIQILMRKALWDFAAMGVDLIVPVAQSHRDWIEKNNYLPDGVRTVDISLTYTGPYVQLGEYKKMKLNQKEDDLLIFSTEPNNSHIFPALLKKPWLNVPPPMVNYVLFSVDEAMSSKTSLPMLFANLIGAPTIYNSPACMRQVKKAALKCMSPALLSHFDETARVVPLGINVEGIEKFRQERVDDGVLRFLYGGRMTSHKEIERTVDLVNALYVKEVKVQYTIQTYGVNSCKKLKELASKYDFICPVYNAPQSVFYQNAFTHDVFVCASKIETFGLSFYEMMYCGMVPVFFRRDWQRGLYDEGSGVFVSSDAQCLSALYEIVANKESALKKASMAKEWVLGNMTSTAKNAELLNKIKELGGIE